MKLLPATEKVTEVERISEVSWVISFWHFWGDSEAVGSGWLFALSRGCGCVGDRAVSAQFTPESPRVMPMRATWQVLPWNFACTHYEQAYSTTESISQAYSGWLYIHSLLDIFISHMKRKELKTSFPRKETSLANGDTMDMCHKRKSKAHM